MPTSRIEHRGDELARVLLDRVLGAEQRQRHQERREDHEEHADAVDAHLEVGVEAGDPVGVEDQLEAAFLRVVEPEDRERHEERDRREEQADAAMERGLGLRRAHHEDGAEQRQAEDQRQQEDRWRVHGVTSVGTSRSTTAIVLCAIPSSMQSATCAPTSPARTVRSGGSPACPSSAVAARRAVEVPVQLDVRADQTGARLGVELELIAVARDRERRMAMAIGDEEHRRRADHETGEVALDLTVLEPAREPAEQADDERGAVDRDRIDHEAIDDLEQAARGRLERANDRRVVELVEPQLVLRRLVRSGERTVDADVRRRAATGRGRRASTRCRCRAHRRRARSPSARSSSCRCLRRRSDAVGRVDDPRVLDRRCEPGRERVEALGQPVQLLEVRHADQADDRREQREDRERRRSSTAATRARASLLRSARCPRTRGSTAATCRTRCRAPRSTGRPTACSRRTAASPVACRDLRPPTRRRGSRPSRRSPANGKMPAIARHEIEERRARDRHVLAQAAHRRDVARRRRAAVLHAVHDRAGAEEQARLEERVRAEVEDRGV